MEALRTLGLARGAGPDEVRQTYRSLAKGYAAAHNHIVSWNILNPKVEIDHAAQPCGCVY